MTPSGVCKGTAIVFPAGSDVMEISTVVYFICLYFDFAACTYVLWRYICSVEFQEDVCILIYFFMGVKWLSLCYCKRFYKRKYVVLFVFHGESGACAESCFDQRGASCYKNKSSCNM